MNSLTFYVESQYKNDMNNAIVSLFKIDFQVCFDTYRTNEISYTTEQTVGQTLNYLV